MAISSHRRAKNEATKELERLEYNDNLDTILDTMLAIQLLGEDKDPIEAYTFKCSLSALRRALTFDRTVHFLGRPLSPQFSMNDCLNE